MSSLRLKIALAFTIPLAACVNPSSSSGVYRPTLATPPKSYLTNFPLNRATETEVLQFVGNPDKVNDSAGTKYLTIRIQTPQATGIIEYTYQIQKGVVTDVTYLNSGNFFGVTQRESAKALQGR